MICAVENFHKLSYILRDINPSSFRVKDGEVYLKNFANAIKYVDDDGNHIEESFGEFIGQVEYVSMRTHTKMNQSRKDDLEGIGYCILSLLIGNTEEVDFLNLSFRER